MYCALTLSDTMLTVSKCYLHLTLTKTLTGIYYYNPNFLGRKLKNREAK